MSQFKRQEQGGFQAADRPSTGRAGSEAAPDFSVLEPQSGFTAGERGRGQAAAAPEPSLPKSGGSTRAAEAPGAAPSQVKPAQEAPPKKRYYSPNEVMRKKGCIGCGGMVLIAPFLVTAIGIGIAIL